ncbi:MAG TPA: winged helix-turn-helix transcriptional regulator [Vicinamibacterales bacterium]|nr:winged helix-turn-helix transcriptional regulator [Vicinamibacterales bacterium]
MIKFKVTHVSRPDMDIEARRDLKLLEAVEQDSRVTQRNLAGRLGIALGLTNIYLKRLVRKGYIKCVNVQSNRITYLITPRGIAEKARLTYEFMDYSLHLYGEVRQHLREALAECAAADRRVAIYGRGEAAELAYLSLREFGLEPVAIFEDNGAGTQGHPNGSNVFLGMPVRPLAEHDQVTYDLMIVATLERSGNQLAALTQSGVPKEKLFPLRHDGTTRRILQNELARSGGH